MNLINAAATFVGEAQTETGVRCMEMKIPAQGTKAVDVPVFLIPTRSSGETFVPEAYEKGCTILFTGRRIPAKATTECMLRRPNHFKLCPITRF